MKAVIFDSGPLINFSMNGFLPLLEKLKTEFKGRFLITNSVKKEVYERPLHIPQFELGALRINTLIQKGILEMPESLGINSFVLDQTTKELLTQANRTLKVDDHWVQIVSEAEISCIALSKELKKKNVDSLIAVDERTARMLCERPENLEKLMSQHLHKNVTRVNQLKNFQGLQFIRSSELIYVAYKKGLIDIKDPQALEALLYATKFKGSSISWEELNVLKKL